MYETCYKYETQRTLAINQFEKKAADNIWEYYNVISVYVSI